MMTAGARVLLLKDHPERLLDGAKVSIERMPMLHAIFERTASQYCDSLR
jgi:flagellar motor switch protein FliM